MLKNARKQKILDLVNQKGYVTLELLAQALDTSESTVRRDLTELDTSHQLKRVHGGAESLLNLRYEEGVAEKSVKNVQAKQIIAQRAVSQLNNGDVIFMDAGTTVAMMTDYLSEVDNITVVTNSVHTASTLMDKKIKTIIIGGAIKPTTEAVTGNFAIQQLVTFNFSKAFIGVDGFHVDTGFTNRNMMRADVANTILAKGQENIIITDSSKFGRVHPGSIGPLGKITHVITDNGIPEQDAAWLTARHLGLMLVHR